MNLFDEVRALGEEADQTGHRAWRGPIEYLYRHPFHPVAAFLVPALRLHLSLPTRRLDIPDLDLIFFQRSQHVDRLPRKCLGFVLIVQSVGRVRARVVQDIFSAELYALVGACLLVAPHALHFVHHFFVAAVLGAERIHDLAGVCLSVGRLWRCAPEWRGEKQSQTKRENNT